MKRHPIIKGTAVEETVGVAIKFFKSYGARCNALEHIQNALPVCNFSINRCAGAFRKGFAFGLADVEAIAQVKADLLMSRAVFVLHFIYVRTDDFDSFLAVGHNPVMLFPVSVAADERSVGPLKVDSDCVIDAVGMKAT